MRKMFLALVALAVPLMALGQVSQMPLPGAVPKLNYEATFTLDGAGAGGEGALAKIVDVTKDGSFESIQIVATAATTNRTLQVSCLAKDGTTSLFDFPAITVTAGAVATMVEMRPDIGVATLTGVTYWNVTACPRLKVGMAAVSAGANVNAFLGVYGRVRPGFIRPVRTDYESGSVTAGAALSFTADMKQRESVQVLVEATTTNRALVISCLDAGGTIRFSYPSLTVTAGSKYLVTIRNDSPVPGTEPTGVLHYSTDVCPSMKFAVAAAGAASAKLAVYAR